MTILSNRFHPRPVEDFSSSRDHGSKLCWVDISRSSSFHHLVSWPLGFAFIAYHAYGWSHLSAPDWASDALGLYWLPLGGRQGRIGGEPANLHPLHPALQPPFRPAGLAESSEQALPLWNSFHFSHPPGARVPVQRDPSMSEHVPKVVRGSLLENSFQVSLITSWLAALATAAGPSFRYVNGLTLTSRASWW